MKIGIVGLPNVGKSTLFNALTKSYAADAANFPFCTIEPNIGIVNVVDKRLDTLAQISKTKETIYASVKFVDIAGLVKGAAEGQGLGNKFLSHVREVDAILQVVRHFEDDDVMHVEGNTNPLRDIEIINTELIISDLDQLSDKMGNLQKRSKAGDKESQEILKAIEIIVAALNVGKLAIDVADQLTVEQKKLLQGYNLLTLKPFIYAINVSEQNISNRQTIQKEFQEKLQRPVGIVCAKFESEMMDFSIEDKEQFLKEAGHTFHANHVPTLDDTIKLAFDTLGLMYYFTTGEKESRARTIRKGSTAPQAAAAIHNDFEKGFIKAEVVGYDNFVADGGRTSAKEKGHLRLEGKEYIVQDGDIMVFRFNV